MPTLELTCDDALLVGNYDLHWFEMGISADVRDDWRTDALRFLTEAWQHRELAAFVKRYFVTANKRD